jgi:hypothetical protein
MGRGIASRSEVVANDVVANTGQQLLKEAREVGSGKPLTPVEEYVPHRTTASDIVYVEYRDGYESTSRAITPPRTACGLEKTLCGFDRSEVTASVTLTMRCVRAR